MQLHRAANVEAMQARHAKERRELLAMSFASLDRSLLDCRLELSAMASAADSAAQLLRERIAEAMAELFEAIPRRYALEYFEEHVERERLQRSILDVRSDATYRWFTRYDATMVSRLGRGGDPSAATRRQEALPAVPAHESAALSSTRHATERRMLEAFEQHLRRAAYRQWDHVVKQMLLECVAAEERSVRVMLTSRSDQYFAALPTLWRLECDILTRWIAQRERDERFAIETDRIDGMERLDVEHKAVAQCYAIAGSRRVELSRLLVDRECIERRLTFSEESLAHYEAGVAMTGLQILDDAFAAAVSSASVEEAIEREDLQRALASQQALWALEDDAVVKTRRGLCDLEAVVRGTVLQRAEQGARAVTEMEESFRRSAVSRRAEEEGQLAACRGVERAQRHGTSSMESVMRGAIIERAEMSTRGILDRHESTDVQALLAGAVRRRQVLTLEAAERAGRSAAAGMERVVMSTIIERAEMSEPGVVDRAEASAAREMAGRESFLRGVVRLECLQAKARGDVAAMEVVLRSTVYERAEMSRRGAEDRCEAGERAAILAEASLDRSKAALLREEAAGRRRLSAMSIDILMTLCERAEQSARSNVQFAAMAGADAVRRRESDDHGALRLADGERSQRAGHVRSEGVMRGALVERCEQSARSAIELEGLRSVPSRPTGS